MRRNDKDTVRGELISVTSNDCYRFFAFVPGLHKGIHDADRPNYPPLGDAGITAVPVVIKPL